MQKRDKIIQIIVKKEYVDGKFCEEVIYGLSESGALYSMNMTCEWDYISDSPEV